MLGLTSFGRSVSAAVLWCLLFAACGGSQGGTQGATASNAATGSVSFSVEWGPPAQPAVDNLCEAHSIDEAIVQLWRDGDPDTKVKESAPMACFTGSATMDGVPADVDNLYLVILGSPGEWKGESARFRVEADRHATLDGKITVSQTAVSPLEPGPDNGSWQGAARIWPSSSAAPITDVKVATDGNGKAAIVWRQQDIAGAYFLYAGIYADGGLNASTKISSGSFNADYAQVVMDDRGNAIVVWSQLTGTSLYKVHAVRYSSDTGLWGSPQGISLEAAETDAYSPQIAMDDNGKAMVVWLQEGTYLTTPGNIHARRFSGSWEPIRQVTNHVSANEGCSSPHVAMDNTGTAIAVWVQLSPEFPYGIRASRFQAGAWGPPREISTPGEWVEYPNVAMDGSGNAVAVWQRHHFFIDGSDYQSIHANTYSSAPDAWSRHAEISASSFGNSSYFPQVAMDNGGNAVAVWEQEMNEMTRAVAARSYRSGSWEAAISGMDTGIAGLVLAGSGNGRYVASWQQFGANGERIRSSGYSLSSGWRTPVSISIGEASSAAYPIGIATNGSGNAIAVWQECTGPSPDSCSSIWANRYE